MAQLILNFHVFFFSFLKCLILSSNMGVCSILTNYSDQQSFQTCLCLCSKKIKSILKSFKIFQAKSESFHLNLTNSSKIQPGSCLIQNKQNILRIEWNQFSAESRMRCQDSWFGKISRNVGYFRKKDISTRKEIQKYLFFSQSHAISLLGSLACNRIYKKYFILRLTSILLGFGHILKNNCFI